jgi:hypothetical protein
MTSGQRVCHGAQQTDKKYKRYIDAIPQVWSSGRPSAWLGTRKPGPNALIEAETQAKRPCSKQAGARGGGRRQLERAQEATDEGRRVRAAIIRKAPD